MLQLLDSLSKNFEINSPATLSVIEAAEKHFNLEFPGDYKDFLQLSNGFEGEKNDNYIVLWSAEELIELNQAYNVKEFVSDILIIGSDGAENAFAFDTTNMSIVTLPFIGMGHIPTETLSATFKNFLNSQV